MQQAIDAWSTGLRVTGGALDPQKSWIYPIQFQFDAKGRPHYQSPEDLDLRFTVHDSNLTRCPLNLVHPNSAKETLGVFLSPSGNESAQITYLKSKVAQWVENVKSKPISKDKAMLALTSTIYNDKILN